jgi:hypothetical protein
MSDRCAALGAIAGGHTSRSPRYCPGRAGGHLLGFDWDATNRRTLAGHELEPDDVEWLFEEGDPDVFEHPARRGRFVALGFIPDRRFALVVFEYDAETRWVRG